MTNINNIIREHAIINENISSIKSLISVNNIKKDSADIIRFINMLKATLKVHLNGEDKVFYVNFLKSSNADMKKRAQEFISTIDGMEAVYEKYSEKFNSREKIEKNIEEFIDETKLICNVIENRLKEENQIIRGLIKDKLN